MSSSRLVLGTAQLGAAYGIANQLGQPDAASVRAILAHAWAGDIDTFDTAQAYGDSEQVLGAALGDLGFAKDAHIISKLHPDLDGASPQRLAHALEGSLRHLGVEQLAALLLHREQALQQWQQGLGDTLQTFVRQGKVRRLGVSVYHPAAALQALQIPELAIIQLPANALDHRFVDAGVFVRARQQGVEIHIRSVFLQGLLLLGPARAPAWAQSILVRVGKLADGLGLSAQELCLGYVAQAYPQARILFGAESVAQIDANVQAFTRTQPAKLVASVQAALRGTEEKILNPSLWPHSPDGSAVV